MPNIKFSYLYRDSGNYKNYRSIIFENPAGIALSTLNEAIQSKLIDGTWFYAAEWGLPDLCSNTFNLETDPTWHEFESVEFTNEPATIHFLIILILSRSCSHVRPVRY
ncbi:hypothetical protein BH09BAC6_BH09BAC6_15400 [soil metagenome]